MGMEKTKWCTLLVVLLLCSSAAWGQSFSGTLPVVFIHTEDTIASKTEYVGGTCYIDPMGNDEFEPMGSAGEPVPMLIRGRGNWTWFSEQFPKKPYKMKFETKQSPLGMAKNKHFALLAHHDGVRAFFRNAAGFYLSRELKMDYTPAEQPVELVLNGSYEGLYFLTETVRVGKHRVNIVEQEDGETDADLVTGGWLVELDNAEDERQLVMPVGGTDLSWLWVTPHSPETLSTEQHDYLYHQFEELLHRLYSAKKPVEGWEEMVDLSSLARYYVINEVLDHVEAFLGSCFMSKDWGEEAWKFGPLWDLGHAFNDWHPKNRFIYDVDGWPPCLIGQMMKLPQMQEAVERVWAEFYPRKYEGLVAFMTSYAERISAAARCNAERWGVTNTADTQVVLQNCLNLLSEKIDFLVSEWGNPFPIHVSSVTYRPKEEERTYNLLGQPGRQDQRGIYISGGRKWFGRRR